MADIDYEVPYGTDPREALAILQSRYPVHHVETTALTTLLGGDKARARPVVRGQLDELSREQLKNLADAAETLASVARNMIYPGRHPHA